MDFVNPVTGGPGDADHRRADADAAPRGAHPGAPAHRDRDLHRGRGPRVLGHRRKALRLEGERHLLRAVVVPSRACERVGDGRRVPLLVQRLADDEKLWRSTAGRCSRRTAAARRSSPGRWGRSRSPGRPGRRLRGPGGSAGAAHGVARPRTAGGRVPARHRPRGSEMSLLIRNATVLTVDPADRGHRRRGGVHRGRPHRRGGVERRRRVGAPEGRPRRRGRGQGRPPRLRQHPQPRRQHVLSRARGRRRARLRDRAVLPDGDRRDARGAPRGRVPYVRGARQERGDHDVRDGGGGRRLRPVRRSARGAELHGRHDLRRRHRRDGQGRLSLRRGAARSPASAGNRLRARMARPGRGAHPGGDDPEHDDLLLAGAAAREPRGGGPAGPSHEHPRGMGRVRGRGDPPPARQEPVRVRARRGGYWPRTRCARTATSSAGSDTELLAASKAAVAHWSRS